MQNIAWIFHIRWVLWVLGLFWVPVLILRQTEARGIFQSMKALHLFRIQDQLRAIPRILRLKKKRELPQPTEIPEADFHSLLFFLCSSFFFLGFLAKCSQLWSLNLNAQDFWLFVDLLEQGKKGGFFLTRFAPQHEGFVQHGSVHPFLFWTLLTPLAWMTSPVVVSLLYNPLMLALAGWMIGILSFRKWGQTGAFIFAFSFLASTHVGKILMYDVHPESAYPFLLFFTFWSFGWDGSREPKARYLPIALCLLCSVKEDAFLILGPWILWGLLFRRASSESKLYAYSLVALVFSTVAQMFLIGELSSGAFGKLMWQGESVYHSARLGEFGEMSWSSLENALKILTNLVGKYGGVTGVLRESLLFLSSKPWGSLLILGPWIVFETRFWFTVLPLVVVYSILGEPKHLWNYYSSAFLGVIWFSLLAPKVRSQWFPIWTLIAALYLGSSSIDFYVPSASAKRVAAEVDQLAPCLRGKGLVSPALLGLVSLDHVWGSRIPEGAADDDSLNVSRALEKLDFVLLTPSWGRYELSSAASLELEKRLSTQKGWRRVLQDPYCKVDLEGSLVSFYVRKK